MFKCTNIPCNHIAYCKANNECIINAKGSGSDKADTIKNDWVFIPNKPINKVVFNPAKPHKLKHYSVPYETNDFNGAKGTTAENSKEKSNNFYAKSKLKNKRKGSPAMIRDFQRTYTREVNQRFKDLLQTHEQYLKLKTD